MRQPPNIVIGVDQRPPFPDLVLLGLQYAFLLCVYLVIVVIIVRAAGAGPDVQRSAVSMAMIAMAVGTLLQSLHRGPIGSGFMAPPVSTPRSISARRSSPPRPAACRRCSA